jgi:hypothetical protein
MCLFSDAARDNLTGRNVQWDLAGCEQEVSGPNRLAVGPDRSGRVGCRNAAEHVGQATLVTLFDRMHRVQA